MQIICTIVIEQIGATGSSLLEIPFGVDFRRLGQYVNISRKNVLSFEIMEDGKSEFYF